MPVVTDYTAILSNSSASSGPGVGAFMSFSFPTLVPAYLHGSYTEDALATFRPFSEAEKTAARTALEAWASVSGLTFFEVAPDEGDIKFMNYEFAIMRPSAAGFAYYPSGTYESLFSSDVFVDDDGAGTSQHLLLHEIGHALGLQHSFDGTKTLPPDLDNFAHTVMSYTSGGTAGDVLGSFDVQAIQYLYGDNGNDGRQVASWSWNAATLTLTQNGGSAAETLIGIGGSDILNAGDGDDLLVGHEGVNSMYGQNGNDTLQSEHGAAGSMLDGGAGNDTIDWGSRSATLTGGAGDDSITLNYTSDARYTISGGDGTDSLSIALWSFTGTSVSIPQMLVSGTSLAGIESVSIYGLSSTSTVGVTVDGSAVRDTISLGGGADTAYGREGADNIYGGGGQDRLYGGGGDDFLSLALSGGMGNALADGGAGSDSLNISFDDSPVVFTLTSGAATGVENVSIAGGNGGDAMTAGGSFNSISLSGNGGNDTLDAAGTRASLYGGDGVDTIIAGTGFNFLYGGAGADRFVFASQSLSTTNSTDQIEDFETGIDRIDLSGMTPTNVAIANHGFGNYITATTSTGTFQLFVRAAVSMSDLILVATTPTGTQGPDTLTGTSGNDTLRGLGGNDTLDGGLGADRMEGGTGDDLYLVDNAGDAVIEEPGGGIDTVRSTVTVKLGIHIENIELTGSAALNASGNNLANRVTGNGAQNWLAGLAGNDVLDGGAGADRLEGGAGDDSYFVDNAGDVVVEAAGAGIDRVYALVSFKMGAEVENLELIGIASINGAGNGLANVLTGNNGDNWLAGLGGNDMLDGGGGVDRLEGGIGDDTYYVDNAGDLVVEKAGEGTDLVYAAAAHKLGAEVENLTLTGSAALNGAGNALANRIIGNGGANWLAGREGDDLLDGGAGADRLEGGVGNDRYVVDNAGDVVVEVADGGGDVVEAWVSHTLAADVESLMLMGSAAITGTGNALANKIFGNGASNVLSGGAGMDAFVFNTALGGSNVDTLGDFVVKDDTIHLDRTIFAGIAANGVLAAGAFVLGTAAVDADDRILYDAATGNLWYDADGLGGGAAVQFARVTAGLALTNLDFVAVP